MIDLKKQELTAIAVSSCFLSVEFCLFIENSVFICKQIQSVLFFDTLIVILMLAEGGDDVRANESRQAIWHTLCSRRHVTIAYLAAKYKISRSTVRDDVDILSLSYPIVTIRGNGGGIKVADWYQPGEQLLTAAQMDLLLRISKSLSGDDAQIMSCIITELTAGSTKCP